MPRNTIRFPGTISFGSASQRSNVRSSQMIPDSLRAFEYRRNPGAAPACLFHIPFRLGPVRCAPCSSEWQATHCRYACFPLSKSGSAAADCINARDDSASTLTQSVFCRFMSFSNQDCTVTDAWRADAPGCHIEWAAGADSGLVRKSWRERIGRLVQAIPVGNGRFGPVAGADGPAKTQNRRQSGDRQTKGVTSPSWRRLHPTAALAVTANPGGRQT